MISLCFNTWLTGSKIKQKIKQYTINVKQMESQPTTQFSQQSEWTDQVTDSLSRQMIPFVESLPITCFIFGVDPVALGMTLDLADIGWSTLWPAILKGCGIRQVCRQVKSTSQTWISGHIPNIPVWAAALSNFARRPVPGFDRGRWWSEASDAACRPLNYQSPILTRRLSSSTLLSRHNTHLHSWHLAVMLSQQNIPN